MSRPRKSIIAEDDDKHSIFDSEQSSQPKRRQKRGSKNSKAVQIKKRTRALSQREIQRKMNRDQQDIMKSLLGTSDDKKPSETEQTIVGSVKRQFVEVKVENEQIKEEEPIEIAVNAPVKNNLDEEEFKIEEEDLTWLDLQEVNHAKKPTKTKSYEQATKSYARNMSTKQQKQQSKQSPYTSTLPPKQQGYYPPPPLPSQSSSYPYPYPPYPPYPYPSTPPNKYALSSYPPPPYPEYAPHPHPSYNQNQLRRPYGHNMYNQYNGAYGMYGRFGEEKYGITAQEIQEESRQYQNKRERNGHQMYGIGSQHQQPNSKSNTEEEQTIATNKQQRRTQILANIEKLHQEFVNIEDQLQTEKEQGTVKQQIIPQGKKSLLFNQWKYQPIQPSKFYEPSGDYYSKTANQIKKEENQTKVNKSKTECRTQMIKELLKENPFLTQTQMADVLRAKDPVMNEKIQRSVVLRILRDTGYKKKRICLLHRNRNSKLNIDLRQQYARLVQKYEKQRYSLFYFDELIVNEYFEKETGWCRVDQEVQPRPVNFINRSVVVLAVLSHQGTCTWDIRFGNYSEKEYCEVVSQLLKNVGKNNYQKVLIANPLPYRKPRHLSELASRRQWDLLVMPAQAIYLNPLQAYFFEVKEQLKRKKFDDLNALFAETAQVMKQCDRNCLGKRIMTRINTYIEKALIKEAF